MKFKSTVVAFAFVAVGCGSAPEDSAKSEHVVIGAAEQSAVVDLRHPDRAYEISSKLDATRLTVISPNGDSSTLHDWLVSNGVDGPSSDAATTLKSPPAGAQSSTCVPVCVQVCTGVPQVCGVFCYYNCGGGGVQQ